jgi:glutamine synthetase
VSARELLWLLCCDLGAIARGRAIFADQLDDHLDAGVGWVPANHALTPLGPLAQETPFGSTGDLRLRPDAATRARVAGGAQWPPLDVVLCDIVETDGRPWECCPRKLLRSALQELEGETGALVRASFEHEFQLLDEAPAGLPFSLEAARAAEPFVSELLNALEEAGVAPERIFAEYAAHQFEVPLAPANGLLAADRAVVLREVVRELARRHGTRASFVPLRDPGEAGNGVHIHCALVGAAGEPLLYDASRPGTLSELGGRFAAGILAHAPALSALTAASPVSAARLAPHRWSAGAVCLGLQNRETLLRIPPFVSASRATAAEQLHLEYRGADASANPHIALAGLVRAGLAGIRERLPAPPLLERDPAELDAADAERFGVAALPHSLEQALAALERDEPAHAGMSALMLAAYTSLKRAEIAATASLELEEVCRRYADIY